MARTAATFYGAEVSSARTRLPAALAGVISVGAGLGLAELAAGLFAPAAGPVLVVGSSLVDLAPGWAKHLMIGLFGTADKTVLIVAVAVVVAVLAAVAGVLERRRPPVGTLILTAGGVVGVVAALTRSGSSALGAVPPIIAAVAAMIALRLLVARIPAAEAADGDEAARTSQADAPGSTRRDFVRASVVVGVLGLLTAAGGFALETGSRTVAAARAALKLPRPAVAAPPEPAGADFGIPGLAPIVTPNASFYRIDTALQVPQIDPEQWKLVITGMVDHEVTLTWQELLALPLEESWTTLTCVSNEVGGTLIGNARWLGYPIRHLLERARPSAGADMVLSTSQDGFTAGTPLEALQDPGRQAILAVGMNGEPLPPEHGFPVRMVVPGLYGYVSATKWVVKLEVTTYDRATAYWTAEGWAPKGPVKLESRIDVVRPQSQGGYVVAGVAWHQHVGVQGVEVMIDGGGWQQAQLSTPISADTWVQWRLPWDAPKGDHTLAVRAIGADGEVQTSRVADVLPDGATGYHTIQVSI